MVKAPRLCLNKRPRFQPQLHPAPDSAQQKRVSLRDLRRLEESKHLKAPKTLPVTEVNTCSPPVQPVNPATQMKTSIASKNWGATSSTRFPVQPAAAKLSRRRAGDELGIHGEPWVRLKGRKEKSVTRLDSLVRSPYSSRFSKMATDPQSSRTPASR